MEKRYYIAYGSNLNVRQMRMRCPHATICGTARLSGWELLFKGSKTGSYLTIEKCETGTAASELYGRRRSVKPGHTSGVSVSFSHIFKRCITCKYIFLASVEKFF